MGVLAFAYSLQLHDPGRVGVNTGEFETRIELIEDQADAQGSVAVGGAQKKIAFLLIVTTAGSLLLRAAYLGRLRVGDLTLLVGCYLAWAAVSLLWSVAPAGTLRELVRLFATASLAYGLAANFSLQDCLRVLMAICAGSVSTAFLLEIGFGVLTPHVAGYRFAGGVHPNFIAIHATLLATITAGLLTGRPASRWYQFWLALAFLALILTKSRTALMCGMMGVSVAITVAYGLRRTVLLWAIGATTMAGALLFIGACPPSLSAKFTSAAEMGRTESVGSLSGRVPVWEYLADDMQRRPWHGFGYKAYWTAEQRLAVGDKVGWYPPDAHSAYFDVTIQLGLMGLALYLTLGGLLGWRLLTWCPSNKQNRSARAAMSGLLIVAIVHGFTESTVCEARIAGLALAVTLFCCSRPLLPQRVSRSTHRSALPSTALLPASS